MNRRRIMRLSALLLTAVLVCGALAGCGAKTGEEVPVQAVSAIVGRGGVGLVNRFAGLVVAGKTENINLDGNMTVDELRVEAGQEVREGDVLFTYDTEAMQLALEQAELEIENLQNTIAVNENQIAELKKQLEKAKTSSDELSITLEIQSLEMANRETAYNIKLKQADLERQRAALENTEVTSPVSGTVTAVNDRGQTDNYGNPLPYIVISETANLRIKGSVNELNAGSLFPGVAVTVISRINDADRWAGEVQNIDYENASSGNGDNGYYMGYSDEMTGTSKYPFYVTLDSSEGLFLGQHVYIQIGEDDTPRDEPLLALPSYFINDPEGKPWVWADNGKGRLEKRSLTLGEYLPESDSYEIVSGLTRQDAITFDDPDLKEGMRTVVVDENSFVTPGMEGVEGFEGEEFNGGFEGEEFGDFEGGGDFDAVPPVGEPAPAGPEG